MNVEGVSKDDFKACYTHDYTYILEKILKDT